MELFWCIVCVQQWVGFVLVKIDTFLLQDIPVLKSHSCVFWDELSFSLHCCWKWLPWNFEVSTFMVLWAKGRAYVTWIRLQVVFFKRFELHYLQINQCYNFGFEQHLYLQNLNLFVSTWQSYRVIASEAHMFFMSLHRLIPGQLETICPTKIFCVVYLCLGCTEFWDLLCFSFVLHVLVDLAQNCVPCVSFKEMFFILFQRLVYHPKVAVMW